MRCRNNDIIPKGLIVNLSGNTPLNASVLRFKSSLDSARVRANIEDIRRRIYQEKYQAEGIATTLREAFRAADFRWLERTINTSRQRKGKTVKEKHRRKYDALLDEQKKI